MRTSSGVAACVVADGPTDLIVYPRSRLDFVDLTDHLDDRVRAADLAEGACVAFVRHTTCALVINEWEAGALADFRRVLDELFPPDAYYQHDDLRRRTQNLVPGERRNGHAHVAQMLTGGSSLTIPVRSGELLLGRWQRVILIELDAPKKRSVAVQLMGSMRDVPLRQDEPHRRSTLPRLIA